MANRTVRGTEVVTGQGQADNPAHREGEDRGSGVQESAGGIAEYSITPGLEDYVEPTEVGVCMTCGMIETLVAAMPVRDDHTCTFVQMPVMMALQMAEGLEKQRKQSKLPRCADCGRVPCEIWSFSEGKARCKPCARINWRAIWMDATEDRVEAEVAANEAMMNIEVRLK